MAAEGFGAHTLCFPSANRLMFLMRDCDVMTISVHAPCLHLIVDSSEAVWQKFFEKNPWIFGYGLSYIHLSALDDKKLEQVVHGHTVSEHGKRVDALSEVAELFQACASSRSDAEDRVT